MAGTTAGHNPATILWRIDESKAFGTSLIDEDMQLTFVDEFLPEIYVSNDTAKALFQGGLFSDTKKYKKKIGEGKK